MVHHLVEGRPPARETRKEDGSTVVNSDYVIWIENDGLLTAWLLKNIEMEILILLESIDSTYKV